MLSGGNGERHVQAGALIDAKSENPDSGESSHRNSGIPAAEGVPIQAGRQQSRTRAEQRREQNSQNQHRNPLTTNLIHPVYHNWTGMKRKKSHPLQNVTFLEVTTRFELVNEGFADPCLTTWPRHHNK